MLWVTTQDEDGQLYYFNRATDKVQWEEPREYAAMQDQLEDMARIQQAHAIQTCVHIGLDVLLREALVKWCRTAMPRSARFYHPELSMRGFAHVKAMSTALDASLSARDTALRRTAEVFHLQEQLEETLKRAERAEGEASVCVANLAECKLQLAEAEFTRLSRASPRNLQGAT